MSEVDLTEQLVSVASQVLSADQLPAYLAVTDAKKFVGENGDIDADKVLGPLRRLYGISDTTRPPAWGQHNGQPAGQSPGAAGAAALERRHGVKSTTDQPAAGAVSQPGKDGRSALERRHGVKK